MSWLVNFFQTQKGSNPVRDFILKQDKKVYAKILRLIELLKNNGPFLKFPYTKKIHSNVWELRISGKIAIRIFYCMLNNEFYLLHAFKKKSEKTPLKEIQVALDRYKNII